MNLKGFTLFEVIIAAAILSVITGGIFMVLDTGDKIYALDAGLMDLQQMARQSMNAMVRELHGATSQTIPVAGTSINFNTASATGIQYSLNASNQLVREFPVGSTPQVVGNFITNLSFCCWHDDTSTCTTTCTGSNLVEINLTASNTIRGRNVSFPIKGQARPRNE
ncbi:MAG: prepilin-type N-terminal cleavage/methylation domain-containing protein [Candidatus Omnitrophica bacterium]|nr:prepilin-type N-terminal cleavage/methylation domain-containing protein [Candidatus Omnitrophota bacterium]